MVKIHASSCVSLAIPRRFMTTKEFPSADLLWMWQIQAHNKKLPFTPSAACTSPEWMRGHWGTQLSHPARTGRSHPTPRGKSVRPPGLSS